MPNMDAFSTKKAHPLVTTLAVAWSKWEMRPGNPERANECENAVQAVASYIGTTGTAVRLIVLEGRKAGKPISQACEVLV